MVKLIPCDATLRRRAKQRRARQNFVDVTISKHVTAEQEHVFIVFNSVSLILTFRRNVKRSCDFIDDKCYRSDC